MSTTYLLVTFIAAVVLVVAALVIAKFLAPSSHNLQKFDPYECGIPTMGVTWLQFHVGYYLFAILYLAFDVQIIFMFPWAAVLHELGTIALAQILIFLLLMTLGFAYAWKKGALEWL